MKAWLFSLLALTASLTHAGFNNALDYGSLSEDQKLLFNIYIHGVGSGFQAANVKLEGSGNEPLYCAPDNLSLTPQNYKMIFEKEWKKGLDLYKSSSENGNFPVEFVLLFGLQSTFPCQK